MQENKNAIFGLSPFKRGEFYEETNRARILCGVTKEEMEILKEWSRSVDKYVLPALHDVYTTF